MISAMRLRPSSVSASTISGASRKAAIGSGARAWRIPPGGTKNAPTRAKLSCGRATASPSPRSKSAVADFDHFIEWPKPAYTRFRLGEGRGGGSGGCGKAVPHSTTPTPDPSPQGGGEEIAAPLRQKPAPTGAQADVGISGRTFVPLDEIAKDGITADGTYASPHRTYSYGAHAAHVAVDPGTGHVEVIDYVAVEDVGRIINPAMLHGQAIGALVQGLGAAFLDPPLYHPPGQ